jgi:hypothetical protein
MLEIHDNHRTRTSKVARADHDLPSLESTLRWCNRTRMEAVLTIFGSNRFDEL